MRGSRRPKLVERNADDSITAGTIASCVLTEMNRSNTSFESKRPRDVRRISLPSSLRSGLGSTLRQQSLSEVLLRMAPSPNFVQSAADQLQHSAADPRKNVSSSAPPEDWTGVQLASRSNVVSSESAVENRTASIVHPAVASNVHPRRIPDTADASNTSDCAAIRIRAREVGNFILPHSRRIQLARKPLRKIGVKSSSGTK